MRNMKLIVRITIFISLLLTLSACDKGFKAKLGIYKKAPNEKEVETREKLVIPPNLIYDPLEP